ncbi:MAG: hypothetical protein IPP47_13825 [Bryobacterales bacterium]|nr:hypothetical protein [Bryobacterales bacterium]
MLMHRIFASALLSSALFLTHAQVRADATLGAIVGPVTQGGVNYLIGGASDLVLDEPRGRLYLVNTGQRRIEIYSITQRRFIGTVQTDTTPLSAALSADGNVLYVTCFEGLSLNLIDLTPPNPLLARRVSLPAKPEGVAVGLNSDGQERVLVTTTGTGANNASNVLIVFDPRPEAATDPIQNAIMTPPAPPSPLLPPPSGRVAFALRTNLIARPDRSQIIGFAAGAGNTRNLFVFDVNSGTVLRSRGVNETSTVLSVSPDGKRFMAGLRLFDAETLTVLAQQNAANLSHLLPNGANFNVQQNQGGSAFGPDGAVLYTAFNFAPLQNPAARANVSQLMVNDPDNLLTHLSLKLPESLSGNMAISSDGGVIYALSESGFLIIPVGRLRESPILMPESTSFLLGSDQCGVTAGLRSAELNVANQGSGRFTPTVELVPNLGAGGATPPAAAGGIPVVLQPVGTAAGAQAAMTATAPSIRTEADGAGARVSFTFNAVNNRALGTVVPHDFYIYAPEALNIPPQVRIYQNMRDADARASVLPVPVSPAATEGLVDMVVDNTRQLLFIANSGRNRVEVFDMRSRAFLAPIKVGQLPRSLAMTPDGYTLYVANSGGESISIIDMESRQVIGQVKFPPLPFNSTQGILTPSVIAATERGLQMIMSNGSLWRVIGDEAMPRPVSPVIGATTITAPRTMAAASTGEFLILLDGAGVAYLYDALSDDYVQSRQVMPAPIQGYYGPIAAGPRGQYFVVNGLVLNQALSVVSSASSITTTVGGRPVTTVRPISAVTPLSATSYARFVPPVVAAANVLASDPAGVEVVDTATGTVRGSSSALEGPLATLVANGRVNVPGRTMAVDAQGSTAFVLTTSGLSIVPLTPISASERPVLSANGIVNFASQQPTIGQGMPISIYGRNLGSDASAANGANWPPNLGGVCVTINTTMLPLSLTSATQINAQLPPDLAPGRYPVVVRNLELKTSSNAANITVAKYAPAVLVDAATKQASIYHDDGSLVTRDNPAQRDDRLHLFALGLGPVKGPRLVAGQPTPDSPPGNTDPVKVFFDDPRIKESEMDVEESYLMPGLVGVYRIQVYVPWYRRRGTDLLVTVRIGNVDSPSKGTAVPTVAVE